MTQDQGEGTVRLERDDTTARLIIDNPSRHNAITAAMWKQIADLATTLGIDAGVRVVILRGAGHKAFSTGADISEFADQRQGAEAEHYDGLNDAAFEAIAAIPQPTIAMIEGYCFGGGLALALNCDLRIASEGAQFSLPPARLGLGYHPRWIEQLVRIVGSAKAKELIFTGDRFGYRNAMRLGLLSRVYPPEVFEAGCASLTDMIAANAPLTIRAAKAAIDAMAAGQGEARMEELKAMTAQCMTSEDYKEGQKAFAQRRKPVFKGR